MIEVNHKRQILILAEQLVEKRVACAALLINHFSLAQARVHQKAEAKRQITFVRKIVDGLRAAVFIQLEIVLAQVGDDFPVFVANRGEHADGLDLDRNCGLPLCRPLELRLRLSRWLRRRLRLWLSRRWLLRRLLRTRFLRGKTQEEECSDADASTKQERLPRGISAGAKFGTKGYFIS